MLSTNGSIIIFILHGADGKSAWQILSVAKNLSLWEQETLHFVQGDTFLCCYSEPFALAQDKLREEPLLLQ